VVVPRILVPAGTVSATNIQLLQPHKTKQLTIIFAIVESIVKRDAKNKCEFEACPPCPAGEHADKPTSCQPLTCESVRACQSFQECVEAKVQCANPP
jgi:hypothetical protein